MRQQKKSIKLRKRKNPMLSITYSVLNSVNNYTYNSLQLFADAHEKAAWEKEMQANNYYIYVVDYKKGGNA